MVLEVAVSLNSKDVEIFSKVKGDWKATEILSEVLAVRSYPAPPQLTGRIARQIDHLHRLGTEFEQDRHGLPRSECLCMVSDP